MFQNIGFEGQQLVLDLAEDHSVERVNLIGPEGDNFNYSNVKAGETVVSIPLLNISPNNLQHYSAGIQTLVAVTDDSERSTEIELRPELSITGVKQHSGEQPKSKGNVVVTVENDGTGPTWIYDVYFENAPRSQASNTGDGRGSPSLYLKNPDSKAKTILHPGDSGQFVGQYPPFIFPNKSACNSGNYSAKVAVVAGNDMAESRQMKAELSGGSVPADAVGHGDYYACKEGSFKLVPGSDS